MFTGLTLLAKNGNCRWKKLNTDIECDNEESAKLAYSKFEEIFDDFLSNTGSFGCPLPCQQLVYIPKFEYFHRNDVEKLSDLGNIGENHFLSPVLLQFSSDWRTGRNVGLWSWKFYSCNWWKLGTFTGIFMPPCFAIDHWFSQREVGKLTK